MVDLVAAVVQQTQVQTELEQVDKVEMEEEELVVFMDLVAQVVVEVLVP